MTSVTIKTVTAPPFIERGTRLTPRLHLVVDYTKGGTSLINGKHYPRGYQISVRFDRIADDGEISKVIDGKGDPSLCIEPSLRFTKKRLDSIVAEVYGELHQRLINDLYRQATADRSNHVWPESILPLVDKEAGLHEAVVAVVNGIAETLDQ
jgi:hypothetical protein